MSKQSHYARLPHISVIYRWSAGALTSEIMTINVVLVDDNMKPKVTVKSLA